MYWWFSICQMEGITCRLSGCIFPAFVGVSSVGCWWLILLSIAFFSTTSFRLTLRLWFTYTSIHGDEKTRRIKWIKNHRTLLPLTFRLALFVPSTVCRGWNMYRGVPELVPNGTSPCSQGCDTSVFRYMGYVHSSQCERASPFGAYLYLGANTWYKWNLYLYLST